MSETVVVYNTYTLPNVYDVFTFSEDEKSINFSCKFLILKTTSGSLVSECQDAEKKLTEKNKDLSVNFGGSDEFSFSHSLSTGFLSRPQLQKIDDDLATGTSRAYSFSVTIQLPFSQTGYNYRREGNFAVVYGKNRQKIISFTCLYTAGGGHTAIENYSNNVETWVNTVLSLVGGNYEKVGEDYSVEHENKILNARLQYKEILDKQSSSSLDYAAIVDPQVNFSIVYDQRVGKTISVKIYKMYPRVIVNISYSTQIDKEEVSDSDDLEDVYESTVKPYIISRAYDLLGMGDYTQAGNSYIVESEQKSVDIYNWSISGTISLLAPKSLDAIIELSEVINKRKENGLVYEKIWDGKSHTYSIYGTGAVLMLSRTVTVIKLRTKPKIPTDYALPEAGKGSWIKLRDGEVSQVSGIGQGTISAASGLNGVDAYSMVYNDEYMYVIPVEGISKIQLQKAE